MVSNQFTIKSIIGLIPAMILILAVSWLVNEPVTVQASRVEDLRAEIKQRQAVMAELEEEIKQYEQEMSQIQAKQSTLQNQINQIDLTRRKLASDIALTEARIQASQLTIESLDFDIQAAQNLVDQHRSTITKTLQRLHWLEQDTTNILELVLTQTKWGEVLTAMDHLSQLQNSLHDQMILLTEKQNQLANQISLEQAEQRQLAELRQRLADQKTIADDQRQAQADLLAVTRNEEATYQALLVDRRELMRQVEQEILQVEQEIEVIIDPTQLPQAGPILTWPLDNVRITQYFGNTTFATANPQIYAGRGHNGIDLGASVGTPVRSALRGEVIGVGDTDLACRGASYGKWVLIEHPNGLSTLYAHLSLIRVEEGQVVDTGQIIAFSGNTGYTTGPHLHFTVYASRGVEIGHLQSRVPGCGVYRLPLGAHTSYLNPLSYLTPLNNNHGQ